MTLRSRLNLPAPTDPEEFEEKVQDVLRVRHHNVHLVRVGRRGQTQHGIDGFDPLARRHEGIVWQSTIASSGLLRKLREDLERLDRGSLRPELFIYAVGTERDAPLQAATSELSRQRQLQRRCKVEVLFWDEIRALLLENPNLGRKWYPELFPTATGTALTTNTLLVATHPDEIPDDANADLLRLWCAIQLARICGTLDSVAVREMEGALFALESGTLARAYWSTGNHVCIGSTWYYPNGNHARSGTTWYYPNGNVAGGESGVLASSLGCLEPGERRAAADGLKKLRGQIRQLAVVELAWRTRPVPNPR